MPLNSLLYWALTHQMYPNTIPGSDTRQLRAASISQSLLKLCKPSNPKSAYPTLRFLGKPLEKVLPTFSPHSLCLLTDTGLPHVALHSRHVSCIHSRNYEYKLLLSQHHSCIWVSYLIKTNPSTLKTPRLHLLCDSPFLPKHTTKTVSRTYSKSKVYPRNKHRLKQIDTQV